MVSKLQDVPSSKMDQEESFLDQTINTVKKYGPLVVEGAKFLSALTE